MKMTMIKLLLPASLIVTRVFSAGSADVALVQTCENTAAGAIADIANQGIEAVKFRCMCANDAAANTDGDEIMCEVGEYCVSYDQAATARETSAFNCIDEPLCRNMDGVHETDGKCTCMEESSNIALICTNDEICLAKNGELECKREEYMAMAMGNPRTIPRTMHGNLNVMTCGFVEKHYYHGNYYVGEQYRTACSDPKHWKFSESKTNVALDPKSVEHGDASEFQAHFDKTCCKTLGPNALAGIVVAAAVVFIGLLIALGCCRKSRATVEEEEEE